jgi:hypothetical protein
MAVHVVGRTVTPAGIERSVVSMPAFHFRAFGFGVFGAGAALFVRLCPSLLISHDLISFG